MTDARTYASVGDGEVASKQNGGSRTLLCERQMHCGERDTAASAHDAQHRLRHPSPQRTVQRNMAAACTSSSNSNNNNNNNSSSSNSSSSSSHRSKASYGTVLPLPTTQGHTVDDSTTFVEGADGRPVTARATRYTGVVNKCEAAGVKGAATPACTHAQRGQLLSEYLWSMCDSGPDCVHGTATAAATAASTRACATHTSLVPTASHKLHCAPECGSGDYTCTDRGSSPSAGCDVTHPRGDSGDDDTTRGYRGVVRTRAQAAPTTDVMTRATVAARTHRTPTTATTTAAAAAGGGGRAGAPRAYSLHDGEGALTGAVPSWAADGQTTTCSSPRATTYTTTTTPTSSPSPAWRRHPSWLSHLHSLRGTSARETCVRADYYPSVRACAVRDWFAHRGVVVPQRPSTALTHSAPQHAPLPPQPPQHAQQLVRWSRHAPTVAARAMPQCCRHLQRQHDSSGLYTPSLGPAVSSRRRGDCDSFHEVMLRQQRAEMAYCAYNIL